jgi:hypothetical protein
MLVGLVTVLWCSKLCHCRSLSGTVKNTLKNTLQHKQFFQAFTCFKCDMSIIVISWKLIRWFGTERWIVAVACACMPLPDNPDWSSVGVQRQHTRGKYTQFAA